MLDTARNTGEWAVIITIAVVVALVVKSLVLQAFYIPSESMVPTLEINDRVLVNKLAYKVGDIERGDVIVFKRPPGEPDKTIDDLIKRVIGLPGDTVEARDGLIFINGEQLDEPYLPDGTPSDGPAETTVPPGQLWVMGDNRTNSGDSRVFGPISEDLVVGKAFMRVWPIQGIRLL